MNDLRDRIAAVAQNHVRCDECTFAKTPAERYLHFADAVIRELDDMGIIHLSRVVGCKTGPVGHERECR